MSTSYAAAGGIPVSEPTAFSAYSPVVLDVPGRPVPLEIKVSVPATGTGLPVILLSHGHGMTNFLASLNGYGPLADFWAAHGFVVIQPTHLDSMALGLRDTDLPDASIFWRDRAIDMHVILDRLDEIEAAVPGLSGRIDRDKIAAAGHSLGGGTVSLLLGMQVPDPDDDREKDLSDPRVKAGVMIGAPGVGDEHLSEWAAENYPMMKYIDFSAMSGTGLVIAGDKDLNLHFSDRLSYRWDAFTRSPAGNKTLLMFHGAEHIFGGISGYDAVETSDDNPERVYALRALVWAYLRSQLFAGDDAWPAALQALESAADPIAHVETR
ncbi:chlorophyllase [Microbacterium enclense]|uniref:Chlorophyllase n=1 Tax=Microbacterium enclense TaxID=993073 RepID=A0A3S4LV03_9MICO|nr:chlorophyllase [Microbacterium enclense]RWR16210.1 chlorophyllase [Microbacterium enclense]